jgi:hypothetical protein
MDPADPNRPDPSDSEFDLKPPDVPSNMMGAAILCGFLLVMLTGLAAGIFGVNYFYNQRQQRLALQQLAERTAQEEARLKAAEEFAAAQAIAQEMQRAEQAEQLRQQAQMKQEQERQDRERREAALKVRLERERADRQRRMPEQFAIVHQTLFRLMNQNDPESHLVPRTDRLQNPERVPASSDDTGSGLSWRVHLLPALGLKALYLQFHLNEPWDSEHNKTLIQKMPSHFGVDPETGQTRIRSFLQLDGDTESLIRVGDIRDGLDQTALLFYVGENHSVVWTRPETVHAFDPTTIEQLSSSVGEILLYTRCGSEEMYSAAEMPSQLLQALVTPDGGEHLHPELLFGPWNSPAAELQIRNLFTSNASAIRTENQAELESAEAHAKLRRISEALAKRELTLKAQPETSRSVGGQLSWRVHLLPYLGETELYNQFQLDEPWNSEANLPLAGILPDAFQLSGRTSRTRFLLLLPADCWRDGGQLPAIGAITDPPHLTTVTYLAAPHRGVTWTKPDSLDPPTKSLKQQLGWPETHTVIAGTYSGTTLEIPANLHPSKTAALISTSKGETFELQSALDQAEKPLKLAPLIRPASPITDLITLPVQSVDVATLKAPETTPEGKRFPALLRAIFSYHDAHRYSPTDAQSPDGGPSQLSWRVHLLPFLDESPLYERFHLNEPWDSAHNMALLDFMPEIFGADDSSTMSGLRVITGKGSLFANGRNWLAAPDGLANTVMIVDLDGTNRQPWTQPDAGIPLATLDYQQLCADSGEFSAMLGRGAIMRFTRDTPQEIFRSLATADGRELIDAATLHRWLAHQRGELLVPVDGQRMWEMQRMQEIILAMQNHADVHKYFPSQQSEYPSDTVPLKSSLLSWRVHILPFLGQSALYEQFRLEEPWDSPHNIQLLSSMPDFYRDADDLATTFTTRLLCFMGPGTPFSEPGRSVRMRDVQDGSSQTLAFIQAPDEYAIEWTRPVDIELDLTSPESLEALRPLAAAPSMKTALFDGAIRRLSPGTTPETLKALITPAGSELVKSRDLFLEE